LGRDVGRLVKPIRKSIEKVTSHSPRKQNERNAPSQIVHELRQKPSKVAFDDSDKLFDLSRSLGDAAGRGSELSDYGGDQAENELRILTGKEDEENLLLPAVDIESSKGASPFGLNQLIGASVPSDAPANYGTGAPLPQKWNTHAVADDEERLLKELAREKDAT